MTCPTSTELSRLLTDRTNEAAASFLYSHLSNCAKCQAELDRLSGENELRDWRGSGKLSIASQAIAAESQELIARMARLSTFDDERLQHSTPTVNPDAGDAEIEFAPYSFVGDLGMLFHYRIREEIGKGGMGIVFSAIDTVLNRPVAIKILHPRQLHVPNARDRFLREARAIAVLRHAHVVAIDSVTSEEDALPFIVMEFADGGSLQKFISPVGIDPKLAATWIAQIADGLQAAHSAGLIHRDIKPSNVLLTSSKPSVAVSAEKQIQAAIDEDRYSAKLADFGLARFDGAVGQLTVAEYTHSGAILGTPAYMSPEQLASPASVDYRSDIYSLGVTLYEALTGEVPFRGALPTVLRRIEKDDPLPPRKLNSNIPISLETICLKAMHRDPSKRFASAKDLADDLRRWLAGKPILARPTTATEKLSRWCREHTGIAVLSAMVTSLLVLIAIGSAYFAVSFQRSAQELRIERNKVLDANQQIQLNADDAIKQRRIALESLESLVTKVQTELASRPGTIKLRESILQTALDGLNRITAASDSTTSDQKVLHDHTMVEAYLRKGELLDLLGQTSTAIEEFRKAADIAQVAYDRDPEDLTALRDLGNALNLQAEVHRKSYARESAKLVYDQLLGIREKVALRAPNDVDAQLALLTCQMRLADVEFFRADFQKAAPLYEALLAATMVQEAKHSESTAVQRSLAVAYERIGTCETMLKQSEKADMHLRMSMRINKKLLEQDQENKLILGDLGYVSTRLASLASSRDEHEQAVDYAMQAIFHFEKIAAADPLDSEARMKITLGWTTLHWVELYAGNLQPSKSALEHVLEISEALTQEFPTAAKYPTITLETLTKLSDINVRLGLYEESLKSLQQFEECFEGYKLTADATPALFAGSLIHVRRAIEAHKLVLGGMQEEALQNAQPDVTYTARVYSLYEAARSHRFEESLQLGREIENYKSSDPYTDSTCKFGIARALGLCFVGAGKHTTEIGNRSFAACSKLLQSLVATYPTLQPHIEQETDLLVILKELDLQPKSVPTK